MMLGDVTVHPVLAVNDMEAARNFYEQTLGLKKINEDPGGIYYESGQSKVLVYESQYAGTNQATAAGWEVDDVEATVESLRQKGVTFERYDIPGMTRDGDVHTMDNVKAAWFKDPAGNILVVGNMSS
jgi:catechol 2,3-dioxygenase-like lactoylglutathione lyase family enzyme